MKPIQSLGVSRCAVAALDLQNNSLPWIEEFVMTREVAPELIHLKVYEVPIVCWVLHKTVLTLTVFRLFTPCSKKVSSKLGRSLTWLKTSVTSVEGAQELRERVRIV